MENYNHNDPDIFKACNVEVNNEIQDRLKTLMASEVTNLPDTSASEEVEWLENKCASVRQALVVGWAAASTRFRTRMEIHNIILRTKYEKELSFYAKLNAWAKFFVAGTLFLLAIYMFFVR